MNARAKTDLFGGYRMPVGEAAEITLASLRSYGPEHDHWCIAWAAARDAAWDALAPTRKALQQSALELVERMIALTAAAS